MVDPTSRYRLAPAASFPQLQPVCRPSAMPCHIAICLRHVWCPGVGGAQVGRFSRKAVCCTPGAGALTSVARSRPVSGAARSPPFSQRRDWKEHTCPSQDPWLNVNVWGQLQLRGRTDLTPSFMCPASTELLLRCLHYGIHKHPSAYINAWTKLRS